MQTSRDQNQLQVSGNSPWSTGPHKAASTSTEEEWGRVPGTLCGLQLCVHQRNWEDTGKETEWTQRSSDSKNGIAVHAWKTQHRVDWEAATVIQVEMNYTQQKIIKAIHIKKQNVTSNLQCGHSLSPVWQPLLCPPSTALNLLINFTYLLFWQCALHHKYLTYYPLSHCPYFRKSYSQSCMSV